MRFPWSLFWFLFQQALIAVEFVVVAQPEAVAFLPLRFLSAASDLMEGRANEQLGG